MKVIGYKINTGHCGGDNYFVINITSRTQSPGGLWQASLGRKATSECLCVAGKSILAQSNNTNYVTCMTFNFSHFFASKAIVFLLISGVPLNNKVTMSSWQYDELLIRPID